MKKHSSLRWKIARYLGCFTFLMIAVIFVFQMLLLEPMYTANKVKSIKEVSRQVEEVLEQGDYDEFLNSLQNRSETCILVTSQSNLNDGVSSSGCILTSLSKTKREVFVNNALASKEGTSLDQIKIEPVNEAGEKSLDAFYNIVYTKVVPYNAGNIVIMVSGSITPLNSTMQTLASQLFYIGIFLFVAMILLTWIIYSKIARPITQITKSASTLPHGKYEQNEEMNQYEEVFELNQALAKAAVEIQKADKAKRDLISNVSHDLRTPLTMISGYGEMMMDLPEEKTDENLQVIVDESKRLNTLVNDLLDLSRLQDQRIVLQNEIFDLTSLIQVQMRKYEVYVVQEDFQIEQHLCGKVFVNGDRKRLEQVFNNFMTNAVNYGGEAKHIIVNEIIKDDKVRIEVRDFGEGISEEDLPNVWDRYYKIDKTHVRVSNGSGIGLAIAKEVLDLHQAEYGVISKKDEGSTFWFALPIVKQDRPD